MARASRASRASSTKKATVRVDLSNIGKAFEPGQEYAVRCTEATLEEGTKAPYFNLKLQGLEGSEYESSAMYHRASTSESSLWRLRPLLEAFGIEIPDGPMDLDASDFVDREAMCSTFLDRYDGGSSVKPDEFWPMDGSNADAAAESGDVDIDDLTDEQVTALAEVLEVRVKGRSSIAKLRAALEDEDPAEVAAALMDLEKPDEPPAKATKDGKVAKGGKAAKPEKIEESEVQEASEDELEKIIKRFSLDVDLGDHKTLRKMKNAVIDALEEGGHLED